MEYVGQVEVGHSCLWGCSLTSRRQESWETLSLWGLTATVKKKKGGGDSISLLHELLRYWPTASKIYRRVVCLSFQISHTVYLVSLSMFLSVSPLTFCLLCFFPSFSPLPFSFQFGRSSQRDCKSEHKQSQRIKQSIRERQFVIESI